MSWTLDRAYACAYLPIGGSSGNGSGQWTDVILVGILGCDLREVLRSVRKGSTISICISNAENADGTAMVRACPLDS